MVKQVTPEEVGREIGWEQYHNSTMPFATAMITIDASNLVKFYNGHRGIYHLNTLILYLLVKACEPVKETRLNLIDGKIYQFDRYCISCPMHDDEGKLRICCIPYYDNLDEFQAEYNRLTQECRTQRRAIYHKDMMQIGTSNYSAYNVHLDAAIPAYNPMFNNPMFMIGKITEVDHKMVLKISLSINHVLMDGEHACAVLENFQNLMNDLRK